MNMKVGLIGAGGWGKNLAQSLYELGALGAIAEIRPETRDELQSLCATVYSDHLALLESDLPAVVIATPAATHYALAKEALLSGKHVFVEKPLALSSKEAEELVGMAKDRGRILMVGHLLLYQPAIRFIKDFLDSGNLGEVWSFHHERLNIGRVRSVENALWSLGSHDVAVLLFLVGRYPERIQAWGHSVLQPHVEDDVHLYLSFSGGLQAHIHSSWHWPEKRRRLTIIGSKGMLVFDEVAQTVVFHRKYVTPDLVHHDEGSEILFQSKKEALKLELQHFLECLREGKRPLSDGRSAVAVVKILEEATRQLKGANERLLYS